MNNHILLIGTLLLFALAACRQQTAPDTPPTPEALAEVTATVTDVTKSPTATVPGPTATLLPTLTASPSSPAATAQPRELPDVDPTETAIPTSTPRATLIPTRARPCPLPDDYLQDAQLVAASNQIWLGSGVAVTATLALEPCEVAQLAQQATQIPLYGSTVPFAETNQLAMQVGWLQCYDTSPCRGSVSVALSSGFEEADTLYVTLDGSTQLRFEVGNEPGVLLSGYRGAVIPPSDRSHRRPFPLERYGMMGGYVFVASSAEMTLHQNSAERLRTATEKIRNTPLDELQASPQRLRIQSLGGTMAIQTNLMKFETESWTGIRFLAQYDQAVEPITSGRLRYMFVGVSHDGNYAMQASFPIAQSDLLSLEESVDFSGTWNPQEYFARVKETLQSAPPDTFSPTLLTLDNHINSLVLDAESTAPPEVKETLSTLSGNFDEMTSAMIDYLYPSGRHLLYEGAPYIVLVAPNCDDPFGPNSARAELLEFSAEVNLVDWAFVHNADFANEYDDIFPERHALYSGSIRLENVVQSTETRLINDGQDEETVDVVSYRLVGSDLLFTNGVYVPSIDIGSYRCRLGDG